MQTLHQLVLEGLASFETDPADTDHQRGYHAALQNLADTAQTLNPNWAEVTNDAAVAIAEEAFLAGYNAGIDTAEADNPGDTYSAWSAYEPSETVKALTAEESELNLKVARLEAELRKVRQDRTDKAYMLDAVVKMLGPKGRQVWAMWQAQGTVRIHTCWGPEAVNMDGEEIAQAHLSMKEALQGAAEPIISADPFFKED